MPVGGKDVTPLTLELTGDTGVGKRGQRWRAGLHGVSIPIVNGGHFSSQALVFCLLVQP